MQTSKRRSKDTNVDIDLNGMFWICQEDSKLKVETVVMKDDSVHSLFQKIHYYILSKMRT